MRIELVGRGGFNPSEANRQYALKKLTKLEDFFGEQADLKATIVCKVYKNMHKVEVTIPTKNLTMRAEVNEGDLYAAIDKAVDKLLQQCRKYKTRVKSKLDKEGIKVLFDDGPSEEEPIMPVVKTKELELEPMSQEEAISQMELLGHDFFVYLNKDTHKVSVLYLRDDGNYANIEAK